mmetsp:Transcript_19054/g.59873  ORF Transcript_19054/g.59873 Transcript_19054/m.59873 type:complete len:312 (-) Transcript_19054:265-1200(-)
MSGNSTATNLRAWVPDLPSIMEDLTFVPRADFDYERLMSPWKEMKLHYYSWRDVEIFNGYEWSRSTALNWQIPLAAVGMYVVMIPVLKAAVPARVPLGRFAVAWNCFLSLFSLCGLLACAPVFLSELASHGLYFTICAPAPWYGAGLHGAFVALFIYSKFAELVDTVLLLLSKRPVILLHWWHHITVLLYCWHSYSVQIATGMWYAVMNYAVHTVMYAYYAATQTSLRKAVRPYAIYITLAQLAQMVMGIFVTVRAVLYQSAGVECHVNKTNSILGLAMYSSYFLLFAKLFVENYLLPKKKKKPLPAAKRD